MSQEYIWVVNVKNAPLLKKKCNHCDSDRFYCSEKFRMNAQKKNIDIWLIYRCTKCNNTYNMTLFSRIRTESISKDLFNKFSENDAEIAWIYAFSHEIRRKNNVESDLDSVEYEITHHRIVMEDILHRNEEVLIFKIKYPFEFNLRVGTVIRTCLNLSMSQLDRLIVMEAISIDERTLQKKNKVKNGDRIQIHTETLKSIFLNNLVTEGG